MGIPQRRFFAKEGSPFLEKGAHSGSVWVGDGECLATALVIFSLPSRMMASAARARMCCSVKGLTCPPVLSTVTSGAGWVSTKPCWALAAFEATLAWEAGVMLI